MPRIQKENVLYNNEYNEWQFADYKFSKMTSLQSRAMNEYQFNE